MIRRENEPEKEGIMGPIISILLFFIFGLGLIFGVFYILESAREEMEKKYENNMTVKVIQSGNEPIIYEEVRRVQSSSRVGVVTITLKDMREVYITGAVVEIVEKKEYIDEE